MQVTDSVEVIFLDFAKAFDKVLHRRLVSKLKYHGIQGKILDWISEWLRGRVQRVCIRGEKSSWIEVLVVYRRVQYWVQYYFSFISTI